MLPFGPEPSVFSSAVKNVKVGIYKTIILPVVLYGCETWFLSVREEHKLRVFEKRREGGESCITRSFIICTLRQV
jgi:hypothetical protein